MADRRALVITSPGAIGLQDAAELVPGPGEVVARPVHTGICGTDLELVASVVDPAYTRYPLVPGHEWSGIIESVGPDVTGLEPGQPVIAEGIIPDRVCAQCVQGHTNLCLVYDELGFTRAGAAADQVLLPAQVVHVLSPRVSLLDAALAEPAAVAWRAIGRGQPRPGERIAVVGDGTLALITTHLLRLFSPAELIVCGQRPAQAGLSNGLDWSDDQKMFYYADSLSGGVDVFGTDPDTGALSGRRRFITVSGGSPDGLTLDAESCLWLAVWGTGELRRYTPAGTLDTVVRLPVSQVTSAAFGGADLSSLYITTARENFTPADWQAQPQAGDIFACTPGVTGRLPYLFGA